MRRKNKLFLGFDLISSLNAEAIFWYGNNLQDDGEAKIKISDLLIGQNIIIEIGYGVYTVPKSHFSVNLKLIWLRGMGLLKLSMKIWHREQELI
ncbi:unnamed protein product [Blepharisma stoltei]|uniref:Uncharacterized protein n=1 Tax=Blepharisma stoltei TaxID=1481888 RepID=A0AAU9IB25_9CILI|nr:unnamed protein product [Blepharisma stoltei]